MQIMGLVRIFKAEVADLADDTVTIEVMFLVCVDLKITHAVVLMVLSCDYVEGNWRSRKDGCNAEDSEQIWNQRNC
jgi:hypothetical protein